ncbi:hypothetical protein ACFTQ7_17445 [Lysinibacillus sp. NPDC056959]|uniref:hypothetical protein n=1 Tax=Lysinibacillus sp. NPDC056959 TaxID=3345981 RepID=UPI00364165AE
MKQKLFSSLSFIFLILTFFMFGYDSGKWYSNFFDFLYDVSIYMPFLLGGLGILTAIFGIKGNIRGILIILNSFLLIMFLLAFLMGTFGFKEA